MLSELILGKFLSKQTGTSAQRGTGLGSTATALVEGEGDEMSRAALRYRFVSSAATGIAPVQALPTTAAQWLLYNPANSQVNVYIDLLGIWLVSGTAGAGGTVLAGLCGTAHVPATRPTASVGGIVQSNCNPASGRTSRLIIQSGQTLAASPGWGPLAWMNPTGTVLGQTQMENVDIRGKFCLPPDTGLALAVISPTGTTPLFAPYGIYREYAADIE